MRWPWPRRERRNSGGSFYDAVLRAIEAEAAGTATDSGATAAVEAAAGALSRAFMAATVEGPPWAVEAVHGPFLAQVGRDLVRKGESLHAIRMGRMGTMLVPCASWHWEGGHDPASWTVRATAYGPSTSRTWNLPASSVVFVQWGSTPGQPYVGTGPLGWASTTAKLQYQSERSLADEAAGPIAQLIAIPQDGGGGGEDDPLSDLKADIAAARGKALTVETTAAGWGDGQAAAPRRDWQANRLGPNPPPAFVELARDAFDRTLAACGSPPSLHRGREDGTAQREAIRRWHMGTVVPLARLLETELARKLEAPIRLRFDGYALDMVSRAQVVEKLAKAGVSMGVALAAVGMMEDDA